MTRRRHALTASLLQLACLSLVVATPGSPGTVTESVRCRAIPDQTYALYLPSAYTPERAWPILYMLDPRGRALLPIELYRDAAERHGYILASSYNTMSDGPAQRNYDAMQAMLDDTFAGYRVDPRRLYAVGMSGGARAACEVAGRMEGQMPGVILVGAACAPERKLRRDTPFDLFGIVGDSDFNYREMQDFSDTLDRLGLAHTLVTFEGPHGWHGRAEANRAIEWLELRAMARELRPDESGLADSAYSEALAVAREAAAAGRPVDAWSAYREVVRVFDGLRPIGDAAARLAKLGKSAEVKRAVRQRRKLLRREHDRVYLAREILGALLAPGTKPTAGTLAERLGLEDVKSAAGNTSDEALSAQRELETIFVQASFYLPRQLRQRGDAAGAVVSLELAARIREDSAEVRYGLAGALAAAGRTQQALASLRLAVELGFSSASRLESDEDLDRLRDDPVYRDILSLLKRANP